MKKLRLVLPALTLALCLLLSACGGASEPAQPTPLPVPDEQHSLRLSQESTVKTVKYEGEADFQAFLSMASPAFVIPGLAQAFTPQGMGFDSGCVYISSYSGGQVPSVISAVDLASGELQAEYFLYNPDGTPFSSHVGGLAVTESCLYVSAALDSDGSYSIACIPKTELPAQGSHDVTVSRIIPQAVSPSFMSYNDGILWLGNFYHPDADYGLPAAFGSTVPSADGDYGCYVLGFRLSEGSFPEEESGSYPMPDYVLLAPNKIQGLVCTDGRVVLSQSYGRKNNSALLEYALLLDEPADTTVELDGNSLPAYLLDSHRQTAATTAMPMTEGLCTDDSGSILVLFESGASRYSDGKFRTDCVWAFS